MKPLWFWEDNSFDGYSVYGMLSVITRFYFFQNVPKGPYVLWPPPS